MRATNGTSPLLRGMTLLAIVVLAGGTVLVATLKRTNGASGARPSISFDCDATGETLVISAPGAGDSDLYIHDSGGSGPPRRLRRTSTAEHSPAVSPDGRWVVISRRPPSGDESSLWLVELSTGEERRLTAEEGVYDTRPRFAPDGATVWFARAFLWRRYSMGGWTWDDFDVCTVSVESGAVQRMTRKAFRSLSAPAVTLDKRSVVFSARLAGEDAPVVYRSTVPTHGESLVLSPIGTGSSAIPFGAEAVTLVISDADNPYDYQVYGLSADGTKHRLTQIDGDAVSIRTDANGARMFVLADVGKGRTGYDLYSYDISSGLDKPLPEPHRLLGWRW